MALGRTAERPLGDVGAPQGPGHECWQGTFFIGLFDKLGINALSSEQTRGFRRTDPWTFRTSGNAHYSRRLRPLPTPRTPAATRVNRLSPPLRNG